jgi:flavin-binding protein dodecin
MTDISIGSVNSRKEERVSDEHQTSVAKVVTIIGTSPESFARAADVAVQEAARTLRGITGADVVSMSCGVEDGRIVEYRTTVNIAFGIERS